MAIMSREEMEKHIEAGSSIMYDGRVITTIEGLPSPAEIAIASGDTVQEEKTLEDIKAQREALDAEEKKLKDAQAKAEAQAKLDADAKAKADAQAKENK